MSHVVVDGAGTVGARVCRHLLTVGVDRITVLSARTARLDGIVAALGSDVTGRRRSEAAAESSADVVVVARGAGDQLDAVDAALAAGRHVVTTSDDPTVVSGLLERDDEARDRGIALVVGATFSPGLSCLLAGHGARSFEVVDEIRVASLGTGGPSCARRRLGAMVREAPMWKDGWSMQAAGSGRELVFFPDPIGPRDCYRGALADPYLLTKAFPSASRVSSRLAVPRFRHAFPWLPAPRQPKEDDGPGAIRVELRGRRGGVSDTVVLGAIDRASVASGAVVAVVVKGLLDGSISRRGAFGLAELDDPSLRLQQLAQLGVKTAVFDPSADGEGVGS